MFQLIAVGPRNKQEECSCSIMMVEMDDFIGRELWPWLNHWKWELVEISARPLFAKIGEQHDGYMYLRTSRALPDGCAISAVVVGQFRRGSSDLPVGIVGVCARTLAVGARIISVDGC